MHDSTQYRSAYTYNYNIHDLTAQVHRWMASVELTLGREGSNPRFGKTKTNSKRAANIQEMLSISRNAVTSKPNSTFQRVRETEQLARLRRHIRATSGLNT